MISSKFRQHVSLGNIALVAGVLALAGCAGGDVDDLTGSRMQALPPGTDNKPQPPVEAGDIAIAAQLFSHDVRGLPQVSNLTTPALVRFNGVTSIVMDENHQPVPVDTQPYTTLLRDRLLLGDREKLRFIERQLPPLTVAGKHGHHDVTAPVEAGDADYQVLAELRGKAGGNSLRIQIEFIEIHSGAVLVNEIYRIRPEAPGSEDMSNLSSPPPPDQGQTPLPTSANGSPAYGNNGWTTPVPGVGDNRAPQGQYNPPPPPQ